MMKYPEIIEEEAVYSSPAKNSPSWRTKLHLSKTAANTFYNIGTAVISSAGKSALFLVGPVLLDPAKFGIYAYYLWVTTVVTAFGSSGPVMAAQRMTCRFGSGASEKPFTAFLASVSVLLTGLAVVVMLAMSQGIKATPTVMAAVFLVSLLGSWVALQQAIFQAEHNFRQPFIAESISQILRFILLGLLKLMALILPGSLLLVDAAVSLAKSGFLIAKRKLPPPTDNAERFDRTISIAILRTSILPVTGVAILGTILWQRGEMFFLGKLSGVSSTAYFASASQIGQIFVLAPTAAISSLMPKLAEKAASSQTTLSNATNQVLNLTLLCAIPLYCAAILIGPAVVHFWKPQYAPVSQILPLIMLGRLALLVSSPVSLSLYACGRERMVLAITSVSALSALVVDYYLISRHGLYGAAFACAINQTITGAATIIAGHRLLSRQSYLSAATLLWLGLTAVLEIGFAFSSWRTVGAGIGLLISTIVLVRDPFITRRIIPLFTSMPHYESTPSAIIGANR